MGTLEAIVAVVLVPRVQGGMTMDEFLGTFLVGLIVGILVDRYVLPWLADRHIKRINRYCDDR